jgi:hypothetical protein
MAESGNKDDVGIGRMYDDAPDLLDIFQPNVLPSRPFGIGASVCLKKNAPGTGLRA